MDIGWKLYPPENNPAKFQTVFSKNSLLRQSNISFDNAQAMVAIKAVKTSSRLRYWTAAKVSNFFSSAVSAQNLEKEKFDMSRNSNRINVPEAREAMDKFKMEAANEVGVDLKEGYNGHLTSREAGSVGGQMVKKMIESYERNL